jgi:hypothetical protein
MFRSVPSDIFSCVCWQKLHEVLDYEPVLDEYRAMYGALSQLGWFMQAIAGSPALLSRLFGDGSLYWLGVCNKDDNWLDGGKTYKLTVPQPVPVWKPGDFAEVKQRR